MIELTSKLLTLILVCSLSSGKDGINRKILTNAAIEKCADNTTTKSTDFNQLAIETLTKIGEDCVENETIEKKIRTKRMMSSSDLETSHTNQRMRGNGIQSDEIDIDKLNYSPNMRENHKYFDVTKRTGKVFKTNTPSSENDADLPVISSTLPQMLKNDNTTQHGRQNANPDIQDIITGIVKLLNGNVNVHANVQQSPRRPSHIRINNRGPPRISEAQPPPPLDYNDPHILPPNKPYPFDRPGTPLRPFFNGMIDQTVPSVEQNYRPSFVSQNRPPWQRPRPPIPDRPNHTIRKESPANKYKFTNQVPVSQTRVDVGQFATTINSTNAMQTSSIYASISSNLSSTTEKLENIEMTNVLSSKIKDVLNTQLDTLQESSQDKLNEMNVTRNSIISYSPVIQSPLESSFEDLISTPSLTNTLTPTLPLSSQFNHSKTSAPLLTIPLTSNMIDSTTSSREIVPFSTRHGIVLDDTDFSRQHLRTHIKPTVSVAYQGYGEIFDVTLSAVQGLDSGSAQTQNIKLKPYVGQFLDSSGDEVVSIDGKKSYINLFETSDQPLKASTFYVTTTQQASSEIKGTGYAVVEKDTAISPFNYQKHPYKPKPVEQNLIRIDTCIVGEDSTCDLAQNEKCKIENGVSSCHCKPGYARKKDRDPCRKIVSILMCLRVDKIYDKKIVWDSLLNNKKSDLYRQLSYESIRAIDSALSMTPFSDEFLDAYVNNIFNGDASQGFAGVFVNLTLQLEENGETLRPSVKSDLQKHLLGVINRRNNNIGNSLLYVESSLGSISNLQDLDECTSSSLNDCHANAVCQNIWGSYRCQCKEGLRDPWSDQVQRSGRECYSCASEYCNNRGSCSFKESVQVCTCEGSYYGAQCEIDGEVLGVAIGASVAAIIIILLTLVCLILWSRKWQKEHKNALEGTMFGYVSGTQLKSPYSPYHVSLEDRLRWVHMSDVMGQTNHYELNAGSPIPSCPNLHMSSNAGTLSIADSKRPNGPFQPITMPDYAYQYNLSATKHLDNSSLSEEDTSRVDLLERNFDILRPRSRTNASVTGQSGIYYDVDIDSSEANLYDVTRSSPTLQKHYIPMSTYSVGGGINSTYYKN